MNQHGSTIGVGIWALAVVLVMSSNGRADETSPLEKGTSQKVYALGTGLIKDDGILLTKSNAP